MDYSRIKTPFIKDLIRDADFSDEAQRAYIDDLVALESRLFHGNGGRGPWADPQKVKKYQLEIVIMQGHATSLEGAREWERQRDAADEAAQWVDPPPTQAQIDATKQSWRAAGGRG